MKIKCDKSIKYRIVIIVFVIILFQCCKKSSDESGGNKNEGTLNFEIEIDKDYHIFKVTANDLLITSYVYTDQTIEKECTFEGTVQFTEKYFLNGSGLADSSVLTSYVPGFTSKTYYKYDPDNYLIYISINKTTFKYQDGNCISTHDGTYGDFDVGDYYEYSSLPNYIDIENFNGSYLGKLNKNLFTKMNHRGMMGSDFSSTSYEYVLNSDGLVVQRTKLSPGRNNGTDYKEVSNFKYKYIGQTK